MTYLKIAMLVCDLVEIQQGLVDRLLKLQGRLHGVLTTSPAVVGRLLDVLQNNTTTTLVLELHEEPGVAHLLFGGLAEVLGEPGESHIVALKVVRL